MCCPQQVINNAHNSECAYLLYEQNLERFESILKIMNRYTPGSFYCREHELVCDLGVHPKGSFSCHIVGPENKKPRPISLPVRLKLSTYQSESIMKQENLQTSIYLDDHTAKPMLRVHSSPITKLEQSDHESNFLNLDTPNIRSRNENYSKTHRQTSIDNETNPQSQLPNSALSPPVFSPCYKIQHTESAGSYYEDDGDNLSFYSAQSDDEHSLQSDVSPRHTLELDCNALSYQNIIAGIPDFVVSCADEDELIIPQPRSQTQRRGSLRNRMSLILQQLQTRYSAKKQDKEILRESKRRSKEFRRLSLPEKRRLYSEDEASVFLQSRAQLNAQYVI